MKTVDVAIIGGGAAGLTLASELADQVRIVVLEREEQSGYHASGRSAAVFVPSYGKGLIRNLTSNSRMFYDDPNPEFFADALLNKRGLLRLVLSGGREEHADMISGRPGIETVSIDEAVRLFPMKRQEDFIEASYERDVHDIDTHALLHGAKRWALESGAEFRFGAQVSDLRRDRSGWLVTTPNETFVTGIVVNAAGAWPMKLPPWPAFHRWHCNHVGAASRSCQCRLVSACVKTCRSPSRHRCAGMQRPKRTSCLSLPEMKTLWYLTTSMQTIL